MGRAQLVCEEAVVVTQNPPALRVAGLGVPFGEARGLDDITLSVAAGECVAIAGPSGAGKSTLLRAIAGLAPITAGVVEILGRDVSSQPPERRGAVYLHQVPVLFPYLDVAGNVAFPLRLRGVVKREARRRAADVLSRVRLDGYETRAVSALSGGQRHRVALARALIANPPVLLLDEPLSALDPELRDEVRDAIARVRADDGRGLVLVTHDLEDAALLADRVCVLIDGGIAQDARPAEVFARPATLPVARFLNVPNRIAGTVRTERFEAGRLAWPAPGVADGPAVAVFWPEAVAPASEGWCGTVVSIRQLPRTTTATLQVDNLYVDVAVDASAPPARDERLVVRILADRVHYITRPGEIAGSVGSA